MSFYSVGNRWVLLFCFMPLTSQVLWFIVETLINDFKQAPDAQDNLNSMHWVMNLTSWHGQLAPITSSYEGLAQAHPNYIYVGLAPNMFVSATFW